MKKFLLFFAGTIAIPSVAMGACNCSLPPSWNTATHTRSCVGVDDSTGLSCVLTQTDLDEPNFSISCVSGGANYSGDWIDQSVSCDINFADSTSLLESWNFSTSSSGNGIETSWSETATGQSLASKTISKDFQAGQNRVYHLTGSVGDAAGNSVEIDEFFMIRADDSPPSVPKISLESGASRLENAPEVVLSATPSVFEANDRFYMKITATDQISKVDWESSTAEIIGNGVSGLAKTGILNQNLFKVNYAESKSNFCENSTNCENFNASNDYTEIFEKAGDYTINLEIQDFAGNTTSVQGLKVKIVASDMDPSKTSLSGDCSMPSSPGNRLANGSDFCSFTFLPKDRFENLISRNERPGLAIFTEQNTEGSYDTRAGDLSAFWNGVRFSGGLTSGGKNTLAFSPSTSGIIFDVFSFSPTIKVTKAENSKVSKSTFTATREEFEAEMQFSVPNVNWKGEVLTNDSNEFLTTVPFYFDPWVKTFVTPVGDSYFEAFNSDFEITLGTETEFFVNQTTVDSSSGDGAPIKNLPTKFKTLVRGHVSTNNSTNFSNENLDETDFLFLTDLTSGEKKTSSKKISTTITSSESTATVAITIPEVEHDFLENEAGNEKTRTVIYPGGVLGMSVGNENFPGAGGCIGCPNGGNVSGSAIGADIEGYILTDSIVSSQTDYSFVNLGSVVGNDIREAITKNAYKLIRGISPENSTSSVSLNGIDFSEKTVRYFSGKTVGETISVTLSGTVSGVGTIVIEDGNLLISGNLKYPSSGTNSLGVILINSTSKAPNLGEIAEKGNIFVKTSVQKISGTFFADGSFLSGNSTVFSKPTDSELKKQLLLSGTIFTKNTFGGSLANPPFDAWGQREVSEENAKKFDLHFIRRYAPVDDPSTPTIDESEDEYNPNCVKITPTKCDENTHSFIVRPDGKVRDLPPPGFSQDGRVSW